MVTIKHTGADQGFSENPVVGWCDNDRDVILKEDFSYTTKSGITYTGKIGSKVNGANIPRFFYRIFGSPYIGKHKRPSVIHDVVCQKAFKEYNYELRRNADEWLWPEMLEFIKANKFQIKSKTLGVRIGRWFAWAKGDFKKPQKDPANQSKQTQQDPSSSPKS